MMLMKGGPSALRYAAKAGKEDTVALLLRAGADRRCTTMGKKGGWISLLRMGMGIWLFCCGSEFVSRSISPMLDVKGGLVRPVAHIDLPLGASNIAYKTSQAKH